MPSLCFRHSSQTFPTSYDQKPSLYFGIISQKTSTSRIQRWWNHFFVWVFSMWNSIRGKVTCQEQIKLRNTKGLASSGHSLNSSSLPAHILMPDQRALVMVWWECSSHYEMRFPWYLSTMPSMASTPTRWNLQNSLTVWAWQERRAQPPLGRCFMANRCTFNLLVLIEP